MPNKSARRPLKDCLPRRRGRPSRDAVAMPREEILRRAFAAFTRDGYEGVSLRALAADCGVSDSLLHHHFGSKQQLWREATDSVFAPLYAQLLAILDELSAAQGGDAVRVLQNNVRVALRLIGSNPDVLRFLFRDGEGEDERGDYLRATYMQPYLARLDALFEQAQDSGAYRRVSPASRHVLMFGLIRSLVMPGVLRNEIQPHLVSDRARDAYIDDAITVLYEGLLARPPVNDTSLPGDPS